jgi:hypothetical protein
MKPKTQDTSIILISSDEELPVIRIYKKYLVCSVIILLLDIFSYREYKICISFWLNKSWHRSRSFGVLRP